ncbi:MAG: hypothetical protein ABIE74_10870 [Pseudomonadota bacterium]
MSKTIQNNYIKASNQLLATLQKHELILPGQNTDPNIPSPTLKPQPPSNDLQVAASAAILRYTPLLLQNARAPYRDSRFLKPPVSTTPLSDQFIEALEKLYTTKLNPNREMDRRVYRQTPTRELFDLLLAAEEFETARLALNYVSKLGDFSTEKVVKEVANIYDKNPRERSDRLNLYILEEIFIPRLQLPSLTDQELQDCLGYTTILFQQLSHRNTHSIEAIGLLAILCKSLLENINFEALNFADHTLIQNLCNEALLNLNEMERPSMHPKATQTFDRSMENIFSVQQFSALKVTQILKRGSPTTTEDLLNFPEMIFYGGLLSPLAIPFINEAILFIRSKESPKSRSKKTKNKKPKESNSISSFERIMLPTLRAYLAYQRNDLDNVSKFIKQLYNIYNNMPKDKRNILLDSTFQLHLMYVAILDYKTHMYNFLNELSDVESDIESVILKQLNGDDGNSLIAQLELLSTFIDLTLRAHLARKKPLNNDNNKIFPKINTFIIIETLEEMLKSSLYLMRATLISSIRDNRASYASIVFRTIKNLIFSYDEREILSADLSMLIRRIPSKARRRNTFEKLTWIKDEWMHTFNSFETVFSNIPNDDEWDRAFANPE